MRNQQLSLELFEQPARIQNLFCSVIRPPLAGSHWSESILLDPGSEIVSAQLKTRLGSVVVDKALRLVGILLAEQLER